MHEKRGGAVEFKTHPIKRDIVIDGFNSIYFFEFGKDFSHPPERHNFWELVYVDSGKVNALVQDKGRTLSQGEVIFHHPMEKHAHVSNQKDPNTMLVVSFSTKSEAMSFFKGKIFTADKTAKTLLSLFISEAKRALGQIPSDYRNRDPLDFSNAEPGSFQLLECYLTEFLLTLKRRATGDSSAVRKNTDSREQKEDALIKLIEAFMVENLYTPLTLSDICTKFYIGKSQLCKLFSEHFGDGPIEHYKRLKIAEAKKLLLLEEHSVTRIADLLGFSSIHNFSRSFKNAVGISPTEYKRKLSY